MQAVPRSSAAMRAVALVHRIGATGRRCTAAADIGTADGGGHRFVCIPSHPCMRALMHSVYCLCLLLLFCIVAR